MGCASSQEAKAAGASGAKGASEPPPLEETVSKKELLMNANARMSHASFGNAQKLFQQYRHRQSTLGGSERLTSPGVRGSNTELSRTARMDKRDLRRLLHDVDPELFEFVWGLFDPDKTNAVCADEFVAAMALLSKSASSDASLDDQIKACFAMFDTRDDGRLSYVPRALLRSSSLTTPPPKPRCVPCAAAAFVRCAWIPFCAVAPR